jgi:hypothetical protein
VYGDGEHHDQQCRARADEDEAEEVPAHRVRTEHERLAGRKRALRAGRAVDHQEHRLVRGEPVPVGGDEQQEPAEDGAGHEPRVCPPHRRTVPALHGGGFIGTLAPTGGVPSNRILGRN